MKTATSFAIFASFSCLAQSLPVEPKGSAPAFEVASVRLSSPDSTKIQGPRFETSRGSLTTRGLSLRYCIVLAYQLQPTQIVGPDWMNDVRVDIVAKAAEPVGDQRLYLMLRTLLAERFSLKAHAERKEMSVYLLTVAAGGRKFSESATEGPVTVAQGPGGVTILRISMFELATQLSAKPFDRPVIDATGLTGRYDIHINTAAVASTNQEERIDAASSMMIALREQMGLKLQAAKDRVDVLVIDHAEKAPTEN